MRSEMSSQNFDKQLQEMTAIVNRLEETIQQRQSVSDALLKKHQTLREAIDRKTEKLLAEQEKTINEAGVKLHRDILTDETRLKGLKTAIANLDQSRKLTLIESDELIVKLKQKKDEIAQLDIQIEAKNASIISLEEKTINLNEEIKSRELYLSKINTSTYETETLLREKSDEFNLMQQRNNDGDELYLKAEAEYRRKLDTLDAKILEKMQEWEKYQKELELSRQDIAIQWKTLEERDKNLRRRENNVEQGEHKIMQNSDLLNL